MKCIIPNELKESWKRGYTGLTYYDAKEQGFIKKQKRNDEVE
jgi:hypothetical protein